MKTLFFAAAIILSAGAHAAPSQPVDRETYCRTIGSMATHAMEFRQRGYALESVLENAKKIQNESMRDLFKKIALSAYREPSFSHAELQRRSVVDFAAAMTTTCFKSIKEGAQ